MPLVIAIAVGSVIWMVLWAIGVKAFDAFFIPLVLVLLAFVVRAVTPYLPGRSR